MASMANRRVRAVALAVCLLIVPGVASAAPPSNDAFGQATQIDSLPFTGHANNTSATVQADEPAPNCNSQIDHTVWWRFDAASAANLV
ncbi:MAG: hypothetical protein QOG62_2744, partial [Thermoleophilaceae bacterium]|nr:hypothetical protein [Thermoleophilaceae bacterium]